MKRCPECKRDYFDDSLLYCLDDGNALLTGPARPRDTDPRHFAFEAAATIADTIQPPEALPTQVYGPSAPQTANTNAIAVLPFANMSNAEDGEYLSDGLAEELLNVLSRIRGLRVAGRTSAFSFKGKQTTFAEIGRTLNVSSILEGSVRIVGKRVRIAVQLVNAADGYHRWSQTYDRMMDDLFAIEIDIANSVVEELRSRLVGATTPPEDNNLAAEVAMAAKGRAEDPEAHRLMLLGRHMAERRSPEAMAKAMEHFEQALEIDPENAQCWLEIGLVYNARAGSGLVGYAEGFEAARKAAETALRIEPENAAGRALLARVKINQDRDFEGAESEIQQALALEPKNAYILQAAGYVTCSLGRIQESLELRRKLSHIDPLNALALQTLSHSAYLSGSFDEAETAIRRSLEIATEGVYRHALLSLILAEQGCLDEARTEAEKEAGDIWKPWATSLVAIKDGRMGDARAALDQIIQKDPDGSAFQIAEIYTAMGEADEAFEYLNVAASSDPGISQILISPQLIPLHEDPRCEPLLTSIGIPVRYWPPALRPAADELPRCDQATTVQK